MLNELLIFSNKQDPENEKLFKNVNITYSGIQNNVFFSEHQNVMTMIDTHYEVLNSLFDIFLIPITIPSEYIKINNDNISKLSSKFHPLKRIFIKLANNKVPEHCNHQRNVFFIVSSDNNNKANCITYNDILEKPNLLRWPELYSKEPYMIVIGIGDIFIHKMIYDTYGLTNDLIVNTFLIEKYRNNSQKYLQLVKYLMNKFFVANGIRVTYVYQKNINEHKLINLKAASITNYDLSPYFKKEQNEQEQQQPYIVFHTKIRLCGPFIKKHHTEYVPKIKQFFNSYRPKFNIVLLGERNLSNNYETSIGTYHNIYTILKQIKTDGTNRKIIDLTEKELQDVPEINIFERDMQILKHAYCSVNIGCGGPFVMATSICPKTVSLVDPIFIEQEEYIYHLHASCNPNRVICTSVDVFFETLNDL